MRGYTHLSQHMLTASLSTAMGGRASNAYNTGSEFSSPSPAGGSQEMVASGLQSGPDYQALLQHFYITHNLVLFRPRTASRVLCIVAPNCRYHGEVVKGRRDGLGIAQYSSGLTIFGEWKEDLPHGQSLVIFPVGFIMRGTFQLGKLEGHSLITASNKSLFLQTFHQGVLTGCHTVLKKDGAVQMLQFQDGAFHKTLKSKVLDAQEESLIYHQLFRLDPDVVTSIASVSEISIHSKRSERHRKNELKIGTFVLEDQGLFFGVLEGNVPNPYICTN